MTDSALVVSSEVAVRISLLKVGLCAGLLIIGGLICNEMIAQRVVPQEKDVILATHHFHDRSSSYALTVSYEYESTGVDVLEYVVRNATYVVTQHGVANQGTGVLFFRKYRSEWKHRTFGAPPLWNGTHVPSSAFLLPTGRFFTGEHGHVYFVWFDGDACSLFRLEGGAFLPDDPGLRKKDLQAFYKRAFASEDIYWSFALVKHASFFGFEANVIEPGVNCSGDHLFSTWKSAQVSID